MCVNVWLMLVLGKIADWKPISAEGGAVFLQESKITAILWPAHKMRWSRVRACVCVCVSTRARADLEIPPTKVGGGKIIPLMQIMLALNMWSTHQQKRRKEREREKKKHFVGVCVCVRVNKKKEESLNGKFVSGVRKLFYSPVCTTQHPVLLGNG